jgi:single-strand DNA-binding protein
VHGRHPSDHRGQPGRRSGSQVNPSGATVASFRVAVTPRVREGEQWRDGETSFFRCTAWRSLADNLAESVGKGARVIVVGRLRQRSWETPEGEKRSVTEIEADEVGLSLKFAQAQPRKAGREHAAAGRDQFTDEPPF